MAGAAVLASVLPSNLPRLLTHEPVPSFRRVDPLAGRLEAAIDAGAVSQPVAEFYRARGGRPLWVAGKRLRPEAREAAALLGRAAEDGLDPTAYRPPELRAAVDAARTRAPADLVRAELALSSAYAAYVADLHRPPPGEGLAFRDPRLQVGSADPRQALEALASAPALSTGLGEARRMHPIYEGLRAELATHGLSDPLRPLILANMARARALPADPRERYILVDVAARRLVLYEHGEPVDAMRVIVGTPSAQTPTMAGLIRYAKFRPYWNIPPDIVRDEIAPRVRREGSEYLARQNMQILSDWSDSARVLRPSEVDWRAVASGAVTLRMRRLPGVTNVLGNVKLMMPNPLGIYLHDTPNKASFTQTDRMLSHGCVRLEDAGRLTRRLFGPIADSPPAGDDVRVDLQAPMPVYIVYLTLWPAAHGLEERQDVYGRDAPLLTELARAAQT